MRVGFLRYASYSNATRACEYCSGPSQRSPSPLWRSSHSRCSSIRKSPQVGPSEPLPYMARTHKIVMPSVTLFTCSTSILFWSPANSLSAVRNSMQWHSCLSRIGTHGQFQKPSLASAALSS